MYTGSVDVALLLCPLGLDYAVRMVAVGVALCCSTMGLVVSLTLRMYFLFRETALYHFLDLTNVKRMWYSKGVCCRAGRAMWPGS